MSAFTENGMGFEDIASLMLGFYSIYQQKKLHDIELKLNKKHHIQSIEKSQELTERSLNEVKRFYLLELFNDLEQHFQQLNADLIASCKEAERDMFDQRNQSLQTIILSASVMFGALSTVIVNGTLSEGTEQPVVWCFGVSSAVSFGALFTSIVLCIETVIRASLFMYRRAQIHTKQLQEAIDGTRQIMAKMRQKTEASFDTERLKKITSMNEEELENEWKSHEEQIHTYLRHRQTINQQFAEFRKDKNNRSNRIQNNNILLPRLTPRGLATALPLAPDADDDTPPPLLDLDNMENSELLKRKSILQEFFTCFCCCFLRSSPISAATPLYVEPTVVPTTTEVTCFLCWSKRYSEDINAAVTDMTFNEFWEAKCQVYSTWAFGLFYWGTITLLIAISLYLYSKFRYTYNVFEASWVSASIIGIVIILGVLLASCLRINTRSYNIQLDDTDDNKNNQQENKEDLSSRYDVEQGGNGEHED